MYDCSSSSLSSKAGFGRKLPRQRLDFPKNEILLFLAEAVGMLSFPKNLGTKSLRALLQGPTPPGLKSETKKRLSAR